MLERVPEHDRRPLAGALIEVGDLDGERVPAGRRALEADRLPAARADRAHERPVAGADVEQRPGRRNPAQTRRQAGTGDREQAVTAAREAPLVRPVPVAVGALELVLVGPREGGRGAAGPAASKPARARAGGRAAPHASNSGGGRAASEAVHERRHCRQRSPTRLTRAGYDGPPRTARGTGARE